MLVTLSMAGKEVIPVKYSRDEALRQKELLSKR